MVNLRKVLKLISNYDQQQKVLLSKTTEMLQAGFEPAQSPSLGFVE